MSSIGALPRISVSGLTWVADGLVITPATDGFGYGFVDGVYGTLTQGTLVMPTIIAMTFYPNTLRVTFQTNGGRRTKYVQFFKDGTLLYTLPAVDGYDGSLFEIAATNPFSVGVAATIKLVGLP